LHYYNRYSANGCGFIAQGSEFGFGKMYARGINDKTLDRDADRFLPVVSCNTHSLAAVIDAVALGPGKEDNRREARFVCMRRANNLSEDRQFLAAPEAGTHDDCRFGTHQARDAYYIFQTLGLDLNIYSSVIKLNTQYMHMVHFNLLLRQPTTLA
jgi:glyceraldehyde-3-phosphate dehydrogenase/erythrose-4-phosphate dehydrogenase